MPRDNEPLGGPLAAAAFADEKTRFVAFAFSPAPREQLFEGRSVRYWSKGINGTLTGGQKN